MYITIIAIAAFSCGKEEATCVCKTLPDASDKYNYPIKPGTPEWNSIRSTDSLFLVCQLPPPVLASISTDGLVQSCIENPQRFFQFFFSNRVQGRDELFRRLNCYQELLRRQNGAERLVERYRLMEPCCVDGMAENEKGNFSLLFYYTEILLTKDSLINQLSTSSKKSFISLVISKDNIKKKSLDLNGLSIVSRTPGIMILSTIMKTESYQPYLTEESQNSDLRTFIQTGLLTSNDIYDIVLRHAKKFIF